MVIESSMFSVLTPLLPSLIREFGLPNGAAGLLFSAYAAGSIFGGLVGPWVVRQRGVAFATRTAMLLSGSALAAVALAFQFQATVLFRFAGGFGGGLAWVATMAWLLDLGSDDRRGAVVGRIMGLSVIGTLAGPIIGNIASVLGMTPTFAAVAVVCLVTACVIPAEQVAATLDVDGTVTLPRGRRRATALSMAPGAWLLVVTACISGALYVLVPLDLSEAGASDLSIGWIFVLSSALSAGFSWLAGRATDRLGTNRMAGFALSATLTTLVALANVSGFGWIAVVAVGALGFAAPLSLSPNSTAVTLDAENAGLTAPQISSIVLLVYSFGQTLGALLAPVLADGASSSTSYYALAVTVLTSFGAVWLRSRRPG